MEIKSDVWLAERFGHPVYTVLLTPGEQVGAVLSSHIAGASRALYSAKIPAGEIDLSQQLESHDFLFIDSNVAMERPATAPYTPAPSFGITVTPYDVDRHAAVLDVAARSFRHSRFHLDPGTPDEVADAIKYEWVRNYTLGRRGDTLFVAEKDGTVLGFLAALVHESAGRTIAVSDLIGVPPEFATLGVGRLLIQAFIDAYRDRCAALQCGGIYTSNTPSLRLFERMGFSVCASRHIFHKHVA
jgi:GNAT superfamily N-acetyltransferase